MDAFKDIQIDGMKFQMYPLKGFTALRLDKKVVTLLLPVLGGLDNLDKQIDLKTVFNGFAESLEKLSDVEFQKFVSDLLSTTQYLPEGKPPQEITPDVIDSAFRGKILVIYKLLFEVMGYNQFTPFVLVGGGGLGTDITSIFKKLTEQEEK
jgi:hypothetical protein